MNPRPNLHRIVRALVVLSMLTRGFSLLNAQVLATPEQKFEPGYLEAVSTGYDHATSVTAPSAPAPQAGSQAPRADADGQQQAGRTPAPPVLVSPQVTDPGNAMAVKVMPAALKAR